ncbi:MAG: tRNA (adenosine(37)-N6)-dimethylallyltransferase MiaA [Desulfobacterales bacterium]|jgi:tRNA dimethylallyltransferase|nr:tRNA (adenosine(37)-N6)-dimethylallyltransferase MiaA [Desulfobacterales bacterium]
MKAHSAPPPPAAGKPKVIVVCGPTAAGKTAVGIELAAALGGEIISADSMQVYRYMDVGTAKPTAAERAAAAHHLIDVVDPDEPFDAARYAVLARETVAALHRRGKVPLVVGGTGLYIKSLLHGLFRCAAGDPAVRLRLAAEARSEGTPALHARLAACDPQTASRLHPNDTARVVRALEVFEVAGRPISAFQRAHRFADDPFDALLIGLEMERERLYERIDRRVDAMLAAGLEEEVRGLLARGYGPDLKSMQSIGYSHLSALLAGRIDRPETVRTLKRDTRRFAKRQLTWFRATPGVLWLPPHRTGAMLQRCRAFLSRPRS